MIEQIRDILLNIENGTSDTDKIKSSLEACKLIFEHTQLNDEDFKKLQSSDLIIDSVLSIDEIVKSITMFLENSLVRLDEDLKGSDFETEIQENLKTLQLLQSKYDAAVNKYQNLQKIQKEISSIEEKNDELEKKIAGYAQINIEEVQSKYEEKIALLKKLQDSEGQNLMRYKRHLDENNLLDIKSNKISELSKLIHNSLEEMDRLLKEKSEEI